MCVCVCLNRLEDERRNLEVNGRFLLTHSGPDSCGSEDQRGSKVRLTQPLNARLSKGRRRRSSPNRSNKMSCEDAFERVFLSSFILQLKSE